MKLLGAVLIIDSKKRKCALIRLNLNRESTAKQKK